MSLVTARWCSAGQAYHVGLDFIESTVGAPAAFLSDFDPFPLTGAENYFVSQGGIAGWGEDQARRAVALAVEEILRGIDVGDRNRIIAIAVHVGPVPNHLDGQRLNVVMGQATLDTLTLLGQAGGRFDDAQATDTIIAAVYLDEIDELGAAFLTYDTSVGVVNSIAGVTAHELGHVFGIVGHVTTSPDEAAPLPIMATENSGLPTEARLTARRFSASKPSGVSSAQQMIQSARTTIRGDVNLDGAVDMVDVDLLVSNWGLTDRLYYEGDVTGDHLVDAADVSVIASNWTGGPISGGAAFLTAGMVTGVPEATSVALVLCGWGGLLGMEYRRFAHTGHGRPPKWRSICLNGHESFNFLAN